MKFRFVMLGAALAAAASCLVPAGATAQGGDTVALAFREPIANMPGKSMVAVVVTYEPGGASCPHRHARSAFITAYVLSGAIRSRVDDGEVRVFRAGEHFTESPGAAHPVSENASATEPAKLLAVFVVDDEDTELTTCDLP